MMKYIIWVGITIVLFACDMQQPNESPEVTLREKYKKIKTYRTGMNEYEKLEKKTFGLDSIFDFETAKIYEIHCPGECHTKSLLASHLTLPKANTRQTNPFIQCEYFMRQITTFHKNLRQTSTIPQANLNG